MNEALTHVDEHGAARMVDVSEKDVTHREAIAESVLLMKPETLEMIVSGSAPKGDVFATARIAGIMAAKRTSELIPLCHPLTLSSVRIDPIACPPTACISLPRCAATKRPAWKWKP